ncbi:MAG: CoA-binding protein [Candidatus Solibacter sp.]
MATVRDFLAQKRFGFIGVSRQSKDFSRSLFREFLKRGYEPVPVHPESTEIEGVPCFARLADIQPPVEAVLLMTTPSVSTVLTQECVESGIKRIWFYRATGKGSVSAEALATCAANGIAAIPGECPFMFFDGAQWIHRFHGFVKKITGVYPA